MRPVESVAQFAGNPMQQAVVTLLIFENQSHHEGDYGVAACLSKVLVLFERVGFQGSMSLDRVEQAVERFARRVAVECNVAADAGEHVVQGHQPIDLLCHRFEHALGAWDWTSPRRVVVPTFVGRDI
jgi:hypothetical protein